jgi:hypothetical protein
MATKPPQMEHLLPLYDALEEARQAFLDACDEIPLPPPLTEALAAWRQAAEAWNEACYDAATAVREFIGDHSERWIESDHGQAYDYWMYALEAAKVKPEPFEPLKLTLDFASTPPSLDAENEVLPWTPDIPKLDVQD